MEGSLAKAAEFSAGLAQRRGERSAFGRPWEGGLCVRLSDLYAACPSLRKRVASHGGLGRLWVASHQWAVDSEAAEVQLPRATQNIDMSQETMWLQLVADMRKFPLSWNAHLHKDLRGALLGRQLHLAQRFARSPGLRRRLDQEGGLCSLWEKVHKDSVQGQEAVEQTMPSQNYSHVAMPRHTPYTAGYGTMGSATALPAPSYGHFQSSGRISSIPSSYPSSSQENWAQWTEHVPSTRLQQPISRMECVTRSPPEPGLVTGDPSASSSSMQQPPAACAARCISMPWLSPTPPRELRCHGHWVQATQGQRHRRRCCASLRRRIALMLCDWCGNKEQKKRTSKTQ